MNHNTIKHKHSFCTSVHTFVTALALMAAVTTAGHAQQGVFLSEVTPQPGYLTTDSPPTFAATSSGIFGGGPQNLFASAATLSVTGSGTSPAVTVIGGGPNDFNETTADLTTSAVTVDTSSNGINPDTSDTYTGALHYVFDFSPSAATTDLVLTGLLTDSSGLKYSLFLQTGVQQSGAFETVAIFTPVPEASQSASFGLLLGLGLGGLIIAARRKTRVEKAAAQT